VPVWPKFAPAGTTAGIIAGRRDFVRACYHQERGIGRPMKAGKENIAGAIAALEQWMEADHAEIHRGEARRLDRAETMLANIRGLRLEREPDPPGNPFERLMLHVDPRVAGITAFQLGQALASGEPKIVLRTLHADRGYLLLDTRRIDDGELDTVVERVRGVFAGTAPGAPCPPTPQGGDLARQAMARWLSA